MIETLFVVVVVVAGAVIGADLTADPTCTYEVVIHGIKHIVPCK